MSNNLRSPPPSEAIRADPPAIRPGIPAPPRSRDGGMPDRPREAPASASPAPAPPLPAGRHPRSGGFPRRRRSGRPPPGGRCARGGPGSGGSARCAARAEADPPRRIAPPPRHRSAPAGRRTSTAIRLRSRRVPRQRRFDDGGTRVEMAPRQRRVGPPHPPGGDRGAEPAVREVGLGDDHESRGVAVEPVHDAGSALGPAGQSRAAGDERVDQRVVPMAWRGVDDQAGRLVDHGEVLVLVDDDERDGGGLESAGRLVLRGTGRRRAHRASRTREARAGLAIHRAPPCRRRGGPPGCGRGPVDRRGSGRGARSRRRRRRTRCGAGWLTPREADSGSAPSGVLPPHRDHQGDGAAAHGDVGHVERRPAQRADADVEEVHHPALAADAVDQVAGRAAGDQAEGELPERVAGRAGARHPAQDERPRRSRR